MPCFGGTAAHKVVVVMDPGITAPDDYLRLNKSKEKRYAFDYVFDENCGQTEVFNHTTKFLIDGVLNGAPFGGASISSSHEARTPVAST